MDKVHGQLEALHRLMDNGDALGDGYQGYEEKIQVIFSCKLTDFGLVEGDPSVRKMKIDWSGQNLPLAKNLTLLRIEFQLAIKNDTCREGLVSTIPPTAQEMETPTYRIEIGHKKKRCV